jgi:hypothetical protein
MGEAITAVQHVEDALSHSIALIKDVKVPFRISRSEGDKALAKYRSLTLGQAVRLAKKDQLYPMQLLRDLEEFLSERNWLVHKSIAQGRDEWDSNPPWEKLYLKIKGISNRAGWLFHSIEEEMMTFSESNGLDMSKIRALKRKHYNEG